MSIVLLYRLRCPDFPWCHKDRQIPVQPQARHAPPYDVYWWLSESHSGGDGGPRRGTEHEDVQHQRHELHSRRAGARGAEARSWTRGDLQRGSSQAGHRLVSAAVAAGKKKRSVAVRAGQNKVSCLLRPLQIAPVQFKPYLTVQSSALVVQMASDGTSGSSKRLFLSLTLLVSSLFSLQLTAGRWTLMTGMPGGIGVGNTIMISLSWSLRCLAFLGLTPGLLKLTEVLCKMFPDFHSGPARNG